MKLVFLFIFLLLLIGLFGACKYKKQNKPAVKELSTEELAYVPTWTKEAVWYQIFVERFRNGDPGNDPTKDDIVGAYPDDIPPDWKTTPWTQQWYQPDEWFKQVGLPNYWDRMQLRRYGGDLQGVLDQLDYLEELGINAIYFNPLNDAPSLHKYDPRHWRHIDRNFGPDPQGDAKIINQENPLDPATWKWTSADRLFLKLVKACHQRGIRVIMDYSFNHTGMHFWALQDVQAKGKTSEFADWYHIEKFPEKEGDVLEYRGWIGIKYLPELKKDTLDETQEAPFEGNISSPQARQHIFHVATRWLDPNGDGDPTDGVDGYRLDVATEVPLGFWREFRRKVKKIKPEAFLVGEVWWKEWPHELMDPRVFLQGDIFDAIMNYRWYRTARQFFASAPEPLSPSAFVQELERIKSGIPSESQYAMMNLTASHDSPRTSTSLFNRGLYKYHVKPFENNQFRIDRPDDDTWDILKMLLVHQFTYIGAPHIWYGDEVGMWAGDDPDCRKPMIWDDLKYEDENIHPIEGQNRKTDKVQQNKEILAFYKQLIAIRKSEAALQQGDLKFLLIHDEDQTMAYQRQQANDRILVAFNQSNGSKLLEIPLEGDAKFTDLINKGKEYRTENGRLLVDLGALSAVILKSRK